MKINNKKCPYCKQNYITDNLKGEITRINILIKIEQGINNAYKVADSMNMTYSFVYLCIKELEYKKLITLMKGKSKNNRKIISLKLTSNGKKLLEILK